MIDAKTNQDLIETKLVCLACGSVENAKPECKWCHGVGMIPPTKRAACLASLPRCPMCEGCSRCKGSHRVYCRQCPEPHIQTCPACKTCGLCSGTQHVRDEVRDRWLAANEPPPGAA